MELATSILWYLALAAAALYVFLFPGASRWIILAAILIFTAAELVVYFTVRYSVFLLERFRHPFRRQAALRRAVRTGEGCPDYATWRDQAEELDRVDGRDAWKTAQGGPYNAPLIAGLHADLKEAMRRVEAALAAQTSAVVTSTGAEYSAPAHGGGAGELDDALSGVGESEDELWAGGGGSDADGDASFGSFGSVAGSIGSFSHSDDDDDGDGDGDDDDDAVGGAGKGNGVSRGRDQGWLAAGEDEEKAGSQARPCRGNPAIARDIAGTGSVLAAPPALPIAVTHSLSKGTLSSKGHSRGGSSSGKGETKYSDEGKASDEVPLGALHLALPASATAAPTTSHSLPQSMPLSVPVTAPAPVPEQSGEVKPQETEESTAPSLSLLSCVLSPGGTVQPAPAPALATEPAPGPEPEQGQAAAAEPASAPPVLSLSDAAAASSAGALPATTVITAAPAVLALGPNLSPKVASELGPTHSAPLMATEPASKPTDPPSGGLPAASVRAPSAAQTNVSLSATASPPASAPAGPVAGSQASSIAAASNAASSSSSSSHSLASALRDLRTLLQLSARHNVGGTMNESLYSHTNTGTKKAVEDFLSTVADATRLLARTPALPPRLRLRALAALRRTHGHTALCLSGGGGLGQYHTGVVRTLLAQGLLPRVISGTSAGALVAAHVCCRTDDELRESLKGECFAPYMGFDNGLTWLQKAAAWFRRGHVFDPAHWDKLVNWHCAGDLTFQEAYERTGRTLVITATSTHQHEPPLMLSRLTTPRVLVSSAIVASASVPGLLPLATLKEKAPDGTVRECKAPFRDLRDGSFKSDIPMSELAFYCNVNYFIVSQVNPHIAPFFFFSQGDAGRGVGRWAGWRGGYLLSFLESLLKHDMRKNLAVLRDMGMLPTIMGADWSFLFLQPFGGHVTLVPPLHLRDYVHIIDAPSVEDSDRYFRDGELMVWRKTTLIETRVRFGKVLVEEMERLRAEIGGKTAADAGNGVVGDSAGAGAAPAEPPGQTALAEAVGAATD